jgi:exonuclease SbcC
MRPLRLLLDGFGSYRHLAEADFSDVDFFALTGPTGSGKSTLIDGLCFALYGTVPRWGKENAIADALAPAANACRVCLVFEAAGRRYAAVRALTRDKKGQVHTKEARLELLDPAIAPGAPIADILAASVEQIAEGPDQVTSGVEDILGLSYRHFTQSVLLPQGRFADFLQATSGDRQKLLVELLAFGVYKEVGERARERAKLAAERLRGAQRERGELAGATGAAEALAAARLEALEGLAADVDAALSDLARLTAEADEAGRQAAAACEQASVLATLRAPAKVADLAARIGKADRLVTECRRLWEAAEQAVADAERVRGALPDKTQMQTLRQAHCEHRELTSLLERHEQELTAKQAAQASQAGKLQAAERNSQLGQDALTQAQRAHAAAALAEGLQAGDQCPVCFQPVTSIPHRREPADLTRARASAEAAAKEHKRALDSDAAAAQATAIARSTVAGTRQRLDRQAAALAQAPGEADVTRSLEAIIEADEALRQARGDEAARRAGVFAAGKARSALTDEEREAWAQVHKSRDRLVWLGAPAADGTDLAAAWETLTAWAAARRAELSQRQPELDAAASSLRQRVTEQSAALTHLLASRGITDVTDLARAPAAVAGHQVRAASELSAVRRDRKKAATLDRQILAHREEEQVAATLGQLLRATSFERWLCSEALDSLVQEASVTLMDLSGGQYQLDRDDRNDLVVIDYEDAGARRPVHTLSGGETFQASLALALALSRQVVGLSAGMRDLNSMFLDEGFGTLDADTLETVATTLERLAADSDRMVGIVTHVPALAARVPVRFVVSHTGATSSLRKERA